MKLSKSEKALSTNLFCIIILIVLGLFHNPGFAATPDLIHHELKVKPDLANGQLSVSDTIQLPLPTTAKFFEFQLSKVFRVYHRNELQQPIGSNSRTNNYQIKLQPEQQIVVLDYTGNIPSTPECQFTQQVCSLLNKDGIFLNPALVWYPVTPEGLQTFDISIDLPEGWRSLSQGTEIKPNHWRASTPQDSIYLIAGKFKVHEKRGNIAKAQVYLLNDDPKLAERYLSATEKYLNHYQTLLGDYPYSKFATVESFWESGWGMPSFTVLGPRVMRMPFILYTSFPHEILHNWWGNGVYIDASKGNWAEGLTAYLSDHGLKEKTGKDIAYRRNALNKYASFTQKGNDFPISQFRSRHSNATQAIGYSKLLMVYHMLRQKLGDELFFKGLRQFYKDYQYKYASMDDLIASLSSTAKQDLMPFFIQWIQQTDAPQLLIKKWHKNVNAINTINVTLEQTSSQTPFDLSIPIVAFANGKAIWQEHVKLKEGEQTYTLQLPNNADRLAIDPFFDVLRKPLREEIPANLHAFTDPTQKRLYLSKTPVWWQAIANKLINQSPDRFSKKTSQTSSITSASKNVTIINLGINQNISKGNLTITEKAYKLNNQSFDRKTHSLVYADRQAQTTINIDAPNQAQAEILLRKLPHYGKYSFLIFDKNARNVAKGEWLTETSPMSLSLF